MAHPALRPPRRAAARHQRGAALLTAMIIVTLVSTLAAGMIWQQWRAVQVESAERARAQSAWVLLGALDFAKLILIEDLKSTNGRNFTALTEPWATPLAEARISTFLAVDKSNADDGPEAFLSGYIVDAQSRYNLANLVAAAVDKTPATVAPAELKTLERLCDFVGVDKGVASRIATGLQDAIRSTTGSSGAAAAPLMPQTVEQLTWLGIDNASVQALLPYVTLLQTPAQTPVPAINVNTASQQVLAAVIEGLDLGTAERLVQTRQRTPFKSMAEFNQQLGTLTPPANRLAVRSDYFEVFGRLRLEDRMLTEHSVVFRASTSAVNVLRHERIASVDMSSP